MDGLVCTKLPGATAIDAMTTGRRYGGVDAAAAGIVTSAVDADQVTEQAMQIARPLAAKAGTTLGTIKATMFADVVTGLTDAEKLPLEPG
jgi:enoyl-CoA hydratase/carnithine racemase